MDPVTRTCCALLLGVALAPLAPGPDTAVWCLAVGLGLLALPRLAGSGLLGPRGLLAAVALGIAVPRTIPAGPELHGPVSVLGTRVGASLGRRGDVRLQRVAGPRVPWHERSGRVRVVFDSAPPPAGTPVVVFGQARPVRPVLPGAPDPVRAASLVRIVTELRAERHVAIGRSPHPSPTHDPTGLLAAVALGDRSGLSRETVSRLRRTGTAHLLAISGFHVGVVAGLASALASGALRLVAAVRALGMPQGSAWILGAAAGWLYALTAGAPLSAQRAAGLLALVALGRLAGRSTDAVPLLACVAVALAVVDPSALATPSFQLSFGAVLGLVTFGARWAQHVPDAWPRPLRWAATAMIASGSTTLGTLPAAAWWFQDLAPLSPLANLWALPLMGFGIVPAAAAACFAPAPLDLWAGWLGTTLAQVMIGGLAPLDVEPWHPAVGPVGALALATALALGLRWPTLPVVMVPAILGAPAPRVAHLRITMLDVGQGDAILVEDARDGRTRRWLVDGGPSYSDVLRWLRRRRIRHLDAVVATHDEWDHTAGLPAVLGGVSVEALWTMEPSARLREAADAAGVPVQAPTEHLWPPAGPLQLSANDRSVVLGVGPVLLTGDLERRGERALSQLLPSTFPILKVPHHGSATSTSDALLEAARPELALVSVGAHNRYGHPHPEVLARLEAASATVLRTDLHGTIVVEVGPQGDWSVQLSRSHASPPPASAPLPRTP
ncbi:MAG: DNA internalization-related competence protein ComEC/Rec2 [Myxococcales bacterium]|nr:DNA internalization-related competence protein ComEC/Rec2 [Myxococcales bacterium]